MAAIRIFLMAVSFSNFLIFKLSIIPHRIAAAAHVVAQLEPKGEDHIDDQRRADGQAGCIDEKEADIFDRHAQLITHLGANAKSIILHEKFKCV